ncbi:MAG: ATP-binding protein [Oscillospiraceae bacterium]|nr:ATP-binding protein [Oscillospiraceae bacterium]
MLNITSGRVARPQKLVLYGVEGIGKTSLAAQTPDPLFIDTEGGTAHLDVRRLQKPQSWSELIALINEVAATPEVCRTLVIDTADWAEQMAIDHICQKYKQPGLESFGYGKGYTFLAEEFSRMLAACDDVILSGKNVVITAHARQRRVELPDETGGFDVWGLKLSKQCAPLLKEWPDALLFINYKTYVVATDTNSHKAQGGKRVIYTSHSPVWDAKNRHNLPEELDLSYISIAPIFGDNADTVKTISPAQTHKSAPAEPKLETVKPETLEILNQWMEKAGIEAQEIQTLVAQKGHFPPETPVEEYPEKFVRGWLMHNWSQVVTTIQNDPEHVPF